MKLNTGLAECLGYGGMPSFYHIGKPFHKGNEIGTSLTVAVQLVPKDTRLIEITDFILIRIQLVEWKRYIYGNAKHNDRTIYMHSKYH